MLLQITTQCFEGCSHCMANATPNGSHMPKEAVAQAIRMIKRLKPSNIQVTGGEPTLHPQFYEICVELCELREDSELGLHVILESNGSFMSDPEKTEKVKKLVEEWEVLVQVRTHPKYYPNYQNIINNQELRKITPYVFDDAIKLLPFGRAINYHRDELDMTAKPICTNMFLASRQVDSMVAVIHAMETNGFFCKPLIGADGAIHVGETATCRRLGSIWDTPAALFNTLRGKMPCGKCGLTKNIPQRAMDILIMY